MKIPAIIVVLLLMAFPIACGVPWQLANNTTYEAPATRTATIVPGPATFGNFTLDNQDKIISEEKTALEDYNNEAYRLHWETTHPDLMVQLTPKQMDDFIIFRESNAEKAKRGGLKAITIVQAIDGVVEANRDGTLTASDEMNTSLNLLHELAPENCGNGSAIQIFAQNYLSWSHGGPHICAPCAMCWDPVNNPITEKCDDS